MRIYTLGMVALPAGMLASRFSEVMHRQRDSFCRSVEDNIEANGSISEKLLEQRRQDLFISHAGANSIIANCIDESQQPLNFCPNCGRKLPSQKRS